MEPRFLPPAKGAAAGRRLEPDRSAERRAEPAAGLASGMEGGCGRPIAAGPRGRPASSATLVTAAARDATSTRSRWALLHISGTRATYRYRENPASMARSLLPSQLVTQCGGCLLLVLLVCLPAARAISCYQCNSFEDPDCDKIISGNATYSRLLKPCDGDYDGEEPFCRKTVQTLQRDEPIVRVRRSCSWVRSRNPCYQYEDDDHLEMVCQCFEDGCNAGPAPARASLGAAALATVAGLASAFLRPH